jgi:pyruvate kinase
MPRAKIICTIGPASRNITVLRNMMLAGMDVVRFNFSHGSHAEHLKTLGLVRDLNRKYHRRIAALQDLEGYRIRIGKLKAGVPIALKKRQRLVLTNEHIVGSEKEIAFDYEADLRVVKPGMHIYIDDGNISLLVKHSQKKRLLTEVIIPGMLKERKGVNIPDAHLSFKGLTEKDKLDLTFAVRYGVEYIAQSFIRSRHDVRAVRSFLKGRLPTCKIIAKIENRQGINNIDGIIEESDGIMIARGDMGVSIPLYEVPMVQKMIIKKCNRAGKLVITATQMLESMVERNRPTRAEVADVANAVLDGTDFVMLSAETAAGQYPVEAVKMMNAVIRFTEGYSLKP